MSDLGFHQLGSLGALVIRRMADRGMRNKEAVNPVSPPTRSRYLPNRQPHPQVELPARATHLGEEVTRNQRTVHCPDLPGSRQGQDWQLDHVTLLKLLLSGPCPKKALPGSSLIIFRFFLSTIFSTSIKQCVCKLGHFRYGNHNNHFPLSILC